MVDGRRSDDELRKLISQPDETLQALLDQGFIEVVAARCGVTLAQRKLELVEASGALRRSRPSPPAIRTKPRGDGLRRFAPPKQCAA